VYGLGANFRNARDNGRRILAGIDPVGSSEIESVLIANHGRFAAVFLLAIH
jgi:hypothetical protein